MELNMVASIPALLVPTTQHLREHLSGIALTAQVVNIVKETVTQHQQETVLLAGTVLVVLIVLIQLLMEGNVNLDTTALKVTRIKYNSS